MENLKQAINLLTAVVSTMNTISITGIDNQDKFVGCANAISNAAELVSNHIQDQEANTDGR